MLSQAMKLMDEVRATKGASLDAYEKEDAQYREMMQGMADKMNPGGGF